jgi:integrase
MARTGSGISKVKTKGGVKYRARWDAGDGYATGERKQREKLFATYDEAANHLAEVRTQKAKGQFVTFSEVTVAMYAEAWVAQQHQVKHKTRLGYTDALKPLVDRHGKVPLQKLSKAHMVDLVDHMLATGGRKGQGRTPRTVSITLGLASAMLKEALKEQLVAVNVAGLVKLPKGKPSTVGQAWTPDEARRFLTQITGDRYEAAWRLTMLGLRRGEVLGLRWADVNLAKGQISIQQTRVVAGREVITSSTKNGKPRVIPIPADLLGPLAEFQALQMDVEAPFAGAGYRSTGLVVVDACGTPMRPETYSDLFQDHAKAAQLPRIRLHDARHTAASLLAHAGVPIIVAADILGHDANIYANTYAHLYDEDKRAAISAYDAVLAKKVSAA